MPETLTPIPEGAEDFKAPTTGYENKEAPFPELNESVRPPIPLSVKDYDLMRRLHDAKQVGDLSERELEMLDLINQLQEHAFRDELTGLYARKHWNREVEQEKRSPNRGEAHVFVIDINDFKRFNTEYGHDGGDAVLKHIAKVLGSAARENDVVMRYAGDEFCVIARTGDPMAMAERMHDAVLNTPVEINGQLVNIGIALGIARREDSDADLQDTLTRADDALMNIAKAKKGEAGMKTIGTFGEELTENLKSKIQPSIPDNSETMNLGG